MDEFSLFFLLFGAGGVAISSVRFFCDFSHPSFASWLASATFFLCGIRGISTSFFLCVGLLH